MKLMLVLTTLLLLPFAAVAQENDRHTLNDCMTDNFPQSVTACTQLIERGGHSAEHSADLYTLRGLAHANTEAYDAAINDFNNAIALVPRSVGTYQLRGLVYQIMGQPERSSADMKQALDLLREAPTRPLGAIQNYCVGVSLQAFNTTLAAISSFTAAIEADPALAAPYVKRAEIHALRGETPKAMADFDKAIVLDPRYSAAYLRRALAHARAGGRRPMRISPKPSKSSPATPRSILAGPGSTPGKAGIMTRLQISTKPSACGPNFPRPMWIAA